MHYCLGYALHIPEHYYQNQPAPVKTEPKPQPASNMPDLEPNAIQINCKDEQSNNLSTYTKLEGKEGDLSCFRCSTNLGPPQRSAVYDHYAVHFQAHVVYIWE